jgi:hypothetical protein
VQSFEQTAIQCQWLDCNCRFSTCAQLTDVEQILSIIIERCIRFHLAYSVCSYWSTKSPNMDMWMEFVYAFVSTVQVALCLVCSSENTYTRSTISMFTCQLSQDIYTCRISTFTRTNSHRSHRYVKTNVDKSHAHDFVSFQVKNRFDVNISIVSKHSVLRPIVRNIWNVHICNAYVRHCSCVFDECRWRLFPSRKVMYANLLIAINRTQIQVHWENTWKLCMATKHFNKRNINVWIIRMNSMFDSCRIANTHGHHM